MKYFKILIFFIFVHLYGCAEYKNNKVDNKIYYSSTGFTLIYENLLYENKTVNRKIDNDEILVLHSTLNKNTPIRITNLDNSKFIDLKIYNKAIYPKIFNSLVSRKVANILNLDIENPLVEIIELKKNKTFIAKDGNIFEEEKNVADKAPVDEIQVNDLSLKKNKKVGKKSKKKKFILIISDFYYKDSAISLKKDLIKKTKIDKIFVRKINDKKYRLLIGPFENFNALKTTYISLNNLGFESLNIYNE